ncbi:MAG: nucleotide exchange factor GrpE [Chloroflexi bacterium]|nr:nucleotide exchange factor GrpE [Chloroflexota bacterium]
MGQTNETSRQKDENSHPDEPVESAAQPQPASDQGEQTQSEAPDEVIPIETVENLKQELEQHRKKSQEYFEGWQRERADFSNYKKRIERDQTQVYQNAVASVVKKYLVILDDLERALKDRPETGEMAAWANGIELIYRKLLSQLEAEGVKKMEAEGEMFDPTRHEALAQVDSPDHESGQIVDIIQPGFLLGNRVIRPALVRVAR